MATIEVGILMYDHIVNGTIKKNQRYDFGYKGTIKHTL